MSRLPPKIEAALQAAIREAAREPHRRSEILGSAALTLAARSSEPQHRSEAPVLRALAERIAEAAMGDPGGATRDDFAETLEVFDEAHEQFPGDQDVLARADDLLDERATKGERLSIAPLSWGAGATLGRSGRFRYDPSQSEIANNVAQSATLAYWQGEPHESQAITIDLAPPSDGQPPALLAVPDPSLSPVDVSGRPRGRILYGADGAITRVDVDAGFGTRFTVVGNYVSIQLYMDPPAPGATDGEMSFTGSMGAFSAPSAAPVFYTVYLDSLAGGATTDGRSGPALIQRPQHAAFLLPILSDQIGGNVILKFFGQGAAQVLTQFVYPLGQLLPPIPLPSEVQYISLTNGTGNTANFRLVFQLSL